MLKLIKTPAFTIFLGKFEGHLLTVFYSFIVQNIFFICFTIQSLIVPVSDENEQAMA